MTSSVSLPAPAHLPVLDGLRGIAVMIVLASHFSSGGLLLHPGLHGVGKSGVYLFFVLSAYLLTRNLLQRPAVQWRQPALWLDYACRRVLRIWPLYLLVLLSSWWFNRQGWPGLYPMSGESLWRHLSLQEGVSVLWSIPVEFTFYLWLPLLAGLLYLLVTYRIGLWWQMLLGVGLAAALLLIWPPSQTVENDIRLGPYVVVFLCGAFAAQLDHYLRMRPWPLALWGAVAVAVMIAWCVAIPAVWCALHGQPFKATVSRNWFVLFGLIWALLLLAVLHGPVWLKRVFSWGALAWTGRISFSLYLWHMPVLWLLRAARGGEAGWTLFDAPWVLACCLLVAWLSYRLIERPLSRWRLPAARNRA